MANNTLPKPAPAYPRDEHPIHLIVYQLIWIPQRRKPVLTGPIATDRRKLIEQKFVKSGTFFFAATCCTIPKVSSRP